MRTLAPCSESSSAVARPMPRALPVTIATLSSRTPMPFASPCRSLRRGAEPYSADEVNGYALLPAGHARLVGERHGVADALDLVDVGAHGAHRGRPRGHGE